MSYAFTTDVAVRYTDVDTYGHVNNAVYATFCEEARIDYLEHVLEDAGASIVGDRGASDGAEGDDGTTLGVVVVNLELDFQRPLEGGDSVEVGVRVSRLGEKSFIFECEVRTESGVHATAETTMVAYDWASQEAVRIPDDWREPIAAFEGLPSSADRTD